MARRVPLSDPEQAIHCIEEDGGVILTGFSRIEDVQRVTADSAPFIEDLAKRRASQSIERGTVRCYRLFGRSETAREKWLQQPELLQIARHFLRTVTIPYNDQAGKEWATDPILSSSATMDISPGVKAQDLHRDDFLWQQTHTRDREEKYKIGSDMGIGLLVPGVETTMENGATLFIPGSHLWDHSRRPKPEEVAYAEMTPGEAFVFLGSTVHAGGTNLTSQNRTVHGFFFCRSYIRPEENQYLWWTKDEIEKWSLAAQKQAGYITDNPYLGHCDEESPLTHFRVNDLFVADLKTHNSC